MLLSHTYCLKFGSAALMNFARSTICIYIKESYTTSCESCNTLYEREYSFFISFYKIFWPQILKSIAINIDVGEALF